MIGLIPPLRHHYFTSKYPGALSCVYPQPVLIDFFMIFIQTTKLLLPETYFLLYWFIAQGKNMSWIR